MTYSRTMGHHLRGAIIQKWTPIIYLYGMKSKFTGFLFDFTTGRSPLGGFVSNFLCLSLGGKVMHKGRDVLVLFIEYLVT